MDTVTPRVILASSSPRRKMLLEQIGLTFDIIPSDIPEENRHGLPAAEFAEHLALEKARAVQASLTEGIVIGADTIVVDGEEILGKPKDEQDAYRMLAQLSGKVHRVITGVALIDAHFPQTPLVKHEITSVKITALTDDRIRWYIRTGEPLDKAGAYAIQGKGTIFVEWIHGCYNNVVGFPLFLFMNMLNEIRTR